MDENEPQTILNGAFIVAGLMAASIWVLKPLTFFEFLELVGLSGVVGGAWGLIFSVKQYQKYGEIFEASVILVFYSWFCFWVYIVEDFRIGFWFLLAFAVVVALAGFLGGSAEDK